MQNRIIQEEIRKHDIKVSCFFRYNRRKSERTIKNMNNSHQIVSFKTGGGAHCITNAIRQVMEYYGYPLSEAMLFGLGSGISFVYVNLANAPMVSGRNKVFEFEKILAKRLKIEIQCKKSKEYTVACKKVKQMLDKNQPVPVYVDMPYMSYLHMDADSHFGGHAIVLFGYDDEKKVFYVSDRDNHDYPIRTPIGNMSEDFHLVSYDEMEKARSSVYRPFPAGNKYLVFDFHNLGQNGQSLVTEEAVKEAVADVCDAMLNPPAQLLGLNGISKLQREILNWRKFTDERLKTTGITNYFQISKDGGTGGGIFRKLYGEFLIEASQMFPALKLEDIGKGFVAAATKWDTLADRMWELGMQGKRDMLPGMSQMVADIHQEEKRLFTNLLAAIQKEA